MSDQNKTIQACQKQLQSAWTQLELRGRLGEALAAYKDVEQRLGKLGLMPFHAEYRLGQQALAACLMRQGDVLVKFKRLEQAVEVRQRQLTAARAAGDLITLAQALTGYGVALLAVESETIIGGCGSVEGRVKHAHHALDEAQRLYESGQSEFHSRGLAKYWQQIADLQTEGLLPGGSEGARRSIGRAKDALNDAELNAE
jgi:tetratricopeptide (TPR) repeat protein